MIPHAVRNLLVCFYRCAAPLEEYFLALHYPQRTPESHTYLFSSMGQRWTARRLSNILSCATKCYLGTEFNISQIRHILPAIVQHYRLDAANTDPSRLIIAAQSGHTTTMLDHRYSILHQSHPQLTNTFIQDTIDFSKIYHRFWGVADDQPVVVTAEDLLTSSKLKSPLATRLEKADELVSVLNQLITAVNPSFAAKLERVDKLLTGVDALIRAISDPPTHVTTGTAVSSQASNSSSLFEPQDSVGPSPSSLTPQFTESLVKLEHDADHMIPVVSTLILTYG